VSSAIRRDLNVASRRNMEQLAPLPAVSSLAARMTTARGGLA